MNQSGSWSPIRTLLTASVFVGLLWADAAAITIRHDVPEADYLALGALPKYASAGHVRGGTTCAVAGGVVINPEWILSAAHCVPGGVGGQSVDFKLGPDNTNPDITIDADNWFRHSSYTNVAGGNDVSLIHLTQPVLSVTPVRLYRNSDEVGQQYTNVGYGRFGTGLTGDNQPRGTKRGGQNTINRLGNFISGVSTNVILSDFDNPNNPGDSSMGSTVPLPLEAQVGLNDSGSPWFIENNGLVYVAAITSFRANGDGTDNSDYGDISGGTRVSRNITWIDANHDRTFFWDGSTGDWDEDARWADAAEPSAANTAVIDIGQATTSNAGEVAKYVFVDGTGRLHLQNVIGTSDLVLNGQGTIRPEAIINTTAKLNMFGGTLEFNIKGTSPGAGFGQFITSETLDPNGTLAVVENDGGGSYAGPTTRGSSDTFTLISALDITSAFSAITYAGQVISEGTTYAGTNSAGDDGLFRIVTRNTELTVSNYLALPGDANGDMTVDGQDFILWNDNKFTSGTDWTTGDFNGDGTTDGQDFIIWNDNKFTSTVLAAPVVPEPSSLALSLMVLAGLAPVRRSLTLR